MKRLFVLCALSAALGGFAAGGWRLGYFAGTPSVAQESGPWQQGAVGAFQAPFPPGQQPGQQAGDAAIDSLTPEERINVAVYRQANRSVVNINTKGVAGNPLLVFEIIS